MTADDTIREAAKAIRADRTTDDFEHAVADLLDAAAKDASYDLHHSAGALDQVQADIEERYRLFLAVARAYLIARLARIEGAS